MSFNTQAQNASGAGGGSYIFKKEVKIRYMKGAQQILFRSLPAFNPSDPNPATSWLPCLDPDGNLTDWGAILKVVKFVGHGAGQGRKDLLSLKTLERPGAPVFCPLDAVYNAIVQDSATWGYLITDVGERDDRNRVRAAFGRSNTELVVNVVDANQPQNGTQLGVFTWGAANKLINRKDGIVYQPNVNDVDASGANYMAAYAYGDITDPNNAPLFLLEKGTDKGDFSAYGIRIAIGQDRRVMRLPVDQSQMAARKDLTKFETFVNVPTAEQLVESLVTLLNGRSALGYHEHALLKMSLPQFRIPEPPAAPAAMPTVQGYALDAAPPTAPYPQAGGIMPVAPPATLPGQLAGGGYAPPQYSPNPPAQPTAPAFDFSRTKAGGAMGGEAQPATGNQPPVMVPQPAAGAATPPGMATVPGAVVSPAEFLARLHQKQG